MAGGQFTIASLKGMVGQQLGLSGWITVDQDRIDAFAACTGDHQWIHVDVERAKRESPSGSTIAHGYLTLSLLAALSYELGVQPGDASMSINYGLDRVRFLNPVRAGQRVRLRSVLTAVEDRGPGRYLARTSNTVEIEGTDRPAMIAEALVLLYGSKPDSEPPHG